MRSCRVPTARRRDDEAPRANEEMLLREEIFPVCSPALLERGSGLRQPGDLARQTLIEEESAAYDESRWAPWLERLGVADEPAVSRLRFSHYGVALSAAIDGLGVALGRAPMIDCELAAGRLVRPFGDKLSLTAPDVHVLSWPEGAERDQRFLAFRDFVLDETCNCELAAGPCGDPAPQQPSVRTGSPNAPRGAWRGGARRGGGVVASVAGRSRRRRRLKSNPHARS